MVLPLLVLGSSHFQKLGFRRLLKLLACLLFSKGRPVTCEIFPWSKLLFWPLWFSQFNQFG
ncbi:hypothetical protein HanRHA438_Chr14g0639801 [Helianthus annuus]|nr:hypothetical protein HanRHA438_Chr14g0639801 [Helianthus annuus]